MKPTKLLQDLGMVRIPLKHLLVGSLCGIVLHSGVSPNESAVEHGTLTSFCCS